MVTAKYFGIALVLATAALSSAQDKVKIEPNWAKDATFKTKSKADFTIGDHHAVIDAVMTWSGVVADGGLTTKIHHDSITIVADDNEVNPPVNDYKVVFDKDGLFSLVEGGIDGADMTRMLLVTHFFVPKEGLAKDALTKWNLAKNDKITMGALAIETTYLGDSEVGKNKVFKFKQSVKETGSDFATTGTYFVTKDGHVLKADVEFAGMPIPAAGGDAKGKISVSPVE